MMFLLNSSSHTSLSSSAPITWSSSFSINVSFLKICAKFRFEIRNTQNIEPGKMSSRVSKAVLTFWNVRGCYFQRRQRFFFDKTANSWDLATKYKHEWRNAFLVTSWGDQFWYSCNNETSKAKEVRFSFQLIRLIITYSYHPWRLTYLTPEGLQTIGVLSNHWENLLTVGSWQDLSIEWSYIVALSFKSFLCDYLSSLYFINLKGSRDYLSSATMFQGRLCIS